MAPRKTERQLNLVICLLAARRFLTRETIRASVEGYQGLSDAAFQRMFERDKDDLRELGIPIETGSNDVLFDDEPGYRILPGDFELPPVEFDHEEQVVLGIAAHVFDGAALAPQATAALGKLRAAGVELGSSDLVQARLGGDDDETFGIVWQALIDRRRIRFDYRETAQTRRVEPWGVLARRGVWYVYGQDLGREAPRMFRLSRVVGTIEALEPPGAYELPARSVVEAAAASLEPAGVTDTALIAIRGSAAPALRRRGSATDAPAPEGYVAYEVPYGTTGEIAEQAAAAGPDALVLSPDEVRDATMARLRAVAGRTLPFEGS
jgi:proteasome accessory factor B